MGAIATWDKSHVAGMLRLAGRLHLEPHAPGGRHRVFLSGLCELVGASSAILLIGAGPDLRKPPGRREPSPSTHTHAAPRILARHPFALPDEVPGPAAVDPAAQKLLRRAQRRAPGITLSAVRREVIDDSAWHAHPFVRAVHARAGLEDVLYSVHVLAPGRAAILSLFRRTGAPSPFAARDCDTVDLLHAQAAFLYQDDLPPASLDDLPLSPRQRQTLGKLLAGRGEKQIATEMNLSPNTVHHYVKSIYKHFKVSSRAELLALWARGLASRPPHDD